METAAAAPGFWDDHRAAQAQMQQLGRLKDQVTLWRTLRSDAASALELTELALEEGDDSIQEQLEAESAGLARSLEREEINLTLSGGYDDRPAIVSIRSGAGGTDSHDWTQMLLGMYTRWAEGERRTLWNSLRGPTHDQLASNNLLTELLWSTQSHRGASGVETT